MFKNIFLRVILLKVFLFLVAVFTLFFVNFSSDKVFANPLLDAAESKQETRYVSGGTWQYGRNIFTGTCYSSYYHPTRKHSSTVRCGGKLNKKSAYAGGVSNAVLNCWTTDGPCEVFYNDEYYGDEL